MSGKYGSPSFSVFLVDGYNLLAAKVKNITYQVTAGMEDTTGLGDSWVAATPTGLKKGTFSQAGAYFDDSAKNIHEVFKARENVSRIACLAWAGNVIGQVCAGLSGIYGMAYDVLAQLGTLTKANVAYTVSGQVDFGVILQEYATRFVDWDTSVEGHAVDGGASSANGGAGYLQVNDIEGLGQTFSIIHSDSGSGGWSTLLTFAAVPAVVGAPSAQRVEVTGTVKRYLAFQANGFGHVSASASASPSRSPSVSASASTSPSVSPSSSRSPSASTSLSPSSSLSPSASASLSPSSSLSPSASISLSPSQSASSSMSPSAGAESVTVFCMFARY